MSHIVQSPCRVSLPTRRQLWDVYIDVGKLVDSLGGLCAMVQCGADV